MSDEVKTQPDWIRIGEKLSDSWSKIPRRGRSGLDDYIQRGYNPGGFLGAVIANDLVGAFGKADNENVHHLIDYAAILYNFFPKYAWKSKKAIDMWCSLGGLNGIYREEGWKVNEVDKDQADLLRNMGVKLESSLENKDEIDNNQ